MDDPWKHYAKWKKPGTKGPHIVRFHLYAMPITDKSIETESLLVIAKGNQLKDAYSLEEKLWPT